MIQSSGSPGLLIEAAETLRIMSKSGMQNLDRYLSAQFHVSRTVHVAHAASPEQRLNFVVSEPRVLFELPGQWWRFQETSLCLFVGCQQRLHFAAQRLICGTGLVQISAALLRIHRQRGFQNGSDFLPGFPRHEAAFLFTGRYSHARAEAQERSTVAAEIDRTSAVSSIDRPPKKRSSTMRPCRASMRASSLRASSRSTRSTSFDGSFKASSSASLQRASRLRERCLRA